MEKLALASSKPVLGLGYPSSATRPVLPPRRPSRFPKCRAVVRASSGVAASAAGRRDAKDGREKLRAQIFASVSSARETSSVGVNPQLAVPPPSSNFGSPLFWIGVGVGLSALFSWLASYLKKYAMQQAMKAMMGSMGTQNNQFGNSTFSPGSPFPFPSPSMTGPATSPGSPFPFPPSSATGPAASPAINNTSGAATMPNASGSRASTVTIDAPATKPGAAPAVNEKADEKIKPEPKKIAFEDVSPDEGLPKSPFEKFEDTSTSTSPKDVKFAEVVTGNGATSAGAGAGASNESQPKSGAGPVMSVEALEKMMEDPTVQQMVYPYLPEEMRNPATFKWMLQNPEYRKQLEDMLNNMGGNAGWDSRMMDTMKNFDISSPEVKQQFDQIGLTPEEVMSKIMANPDVAMAFQNPRVQAAIMDCSQNPFNIAKYQNDKEVELQKVNISQGLSLASLSRGDHRPQPPCLRTGVMDVFNKISELFPGVTGSP